MNRAAKCGLTVATTFLLLGVGVGAADACRVPPHSPPRQGVHPSGVSTTAKGVVYSQHPSPSSPTKPTATYPKPPCITPSSVGILPSSPTKAKTVAAAPTSPGGATPVPVLVVAAVATTAPASGGTGTALAIVKAAPVTSPGLALTGTSDLPQLLGLGISALLLGAGTTRIGRRR